MKISRRAFLIGGTAPLVGGAAFLSGCGGSSSPGCGRSVAIPSRSRAIPSVVGGGAYILSDLFRGVEGPSFLRNMTYPLPAVLNRSGQVALSESFPGSEGCGATILYEPQRWSTNANGRGGNVRRFTNLGNNIWPTVLNSSGLMAGLRLSSTVPFGIVLITVPGSGAASRLDVDPTGEAANPDYLPVDITDSGKVLCLTPRKVYVFANGTADILPDIGTDLRFTGRVLLEDGTVIGYSQRKESESGGTITYAAAPEASFIYRNGTYTDMGAPTDLFQVQAVHANAAGQIIGTAITSSGVIRGFLYENGSFTVIGPDGFKPRAIAENGTIVGQANNRAVLWSAGTLTDLNSQIGSGSGWELVDANAINAAGQIVAVGTHPEDSNPRMTILTRA